MSRRSAHFADPPSQQQTEDEAAALRRRDYSPEPSAGETVLSSLITGSSAANGFSKQPPSVVLPTASSLSAPSVSAPPPSSASAASSLSPPSVLTLSPTSPSLRALWYQARAEASSGRAYWTEEQYVDDITVSFLYQPHTVLALGCLLLYMVYVAFYQVNDQTSLLSSLRLGCSVAAMFVVILGLIVFPSGPFVRPHPLLWRLAFAIAVLYEIVLIVLLFLSKAEARAALTFFDPTLGRPLVERAYAEDCELSWANVSAGLLDQYALSHFVGWVVKSLILRDTLLCWVISVQWELLELAFTHWLPNFAECWWDQWLLDVLLCNGLGIWAGQRLCGYLEMKEYHWRGFMRIESWSGRLHRAVLQFTPQSWQKVRWRQTRSLSMFVFLQLLVVCFHWEEMNAFMLKHLLWIPPPCPLNAIRLGIWAFVGIPSLRQVYTYMTEPSCRRIGTQTFLVLLMLVTELLLIVKFSAGEFTGRRMKPEVQLMCAACLALWLLFNAYYIHRIVYGQHTPGFFADVATNGSSDQQSDQTQLDKGKEE